MIAMSMRKEIESKLPEGLYVLSKDKLEVEKKLDDILRLFNRSLPEGQVVAIFKDGCHKVSNFLADCFTETHARTKFQNRVLSMSTTDNVELDRKYGQNIYYFLVDLRIAIPLFVPFSDLPSCRRLLDFSPEEAAEKAVNLIDNGFVKAVAHSISIGTKVYHICTIVDVHRYYSDLLGIFERDREEGWKPSHVELLFENKCREELEFCKLATLKTTGKLTEEILKEKLAVIEEIRNRKDCLLSADKGMVS